jgi:transposase
MLFSGSSINTRTDKNVCATEAGFFCTVINSSWYYTPSHYRYQCSIIINSLSVCELLEKIAAMALEGTVTLIMDNARYQRCVLVQEKAAELGIEILFLPSYSPKLNLIERLWKFTRKQCLYGKYYGDYAAFSSAIESFLQTVSHDHADELKTLLALTFQTFETSNS